MVKALWSQRTQKKCLGIELSAGWRGSFMAPQTRKSSARAAITFLSDGLRPGLLGKIGDDAFLHTCTEQMPSRSVPCLHFHTTGETVDDLRFVEQSAVKSCTGVRRVPETWCV